MKLAGALGAGVLASRLAGPNLSPVSAAQQVTLTWMWSSNTANEADFWDRLKREYFSKEHPNITITNEFLGGGQLYDKIQALEQAGAGPDIVFWQGFRAFSWAARGFGVNLDPYIQRDKVNISDFDRRIMAMMSYRGHVYALPYDYGAVLLIYNKDLFDAESVPYPTANWTWDDFLHAAAKLTKPEKNQYGFVQSPDFVWGAVPFIWSNGGDYLSDDGRTLLLTEPATVEAIQWYGDLRNKHKVAPAVGSGFSTWRDTFYTGKVGMFIDGPWQALTLRARANFRWDFALIPRGKAGRMSWIAGTGYAISTTSKHHDEAWEFVKAMASRECLTALGKAGRGFPARVSAQSAYLGVHPPQNSYTAVEAVKQARYVKTTATWQEMNNLLNKAVMDNVELGQMTAAQAIKNVMPEMTALLQKSLALSR